MATLSADRLPATTPTGYLAMSRVEYFIIRTVGSGASAAIELTLDVIAYKLAGKMAELTLWRTADLQGKQFPPPAPAAPLYRESFSLVDDHQPHTIKLLVSSYPELVGPKAQLVTLMLSCPARSYRTPSRPFKLEQADKCGPDVQLQVVFESKSAEIRKPQFHGHNEYYPEHYVGWQGLVLNGTATYHDRIVIAGMSRAEATMDGVQSWDDRVVTTGCIQKTVKTDGGGELPEQLWLFKRDEPTRWNCLMGSAQDGGWDVTNPKSGVYHVSYTDIDPDTHARTTYGQSSFGETYDKSLKALQDKIHDIHTKNKAVAVKGIRSNYILDRFVRLGQDEAYQERQILDALHRLHAEALAWHPYGVDRTDPKNPHASDDPQYRYPHTVGEYFRTHVGRAFVLSESVNRPAHVPYYVGLALDEFFQLDWDKLGLPKLLPTTDPASWPLTIVRDPANPNKPGFTLQQRYEQELIKLYAPSLEDHVYVSEINSDTLKREIALKKGVTPGRYPAVYGFFVDSQYDMTWLPSRPRPARGVPAKKKKK